MNVRIVNFYDLKENLSIFKQSIKHSSNETCSLSSVVLPGAVLALHPETKASDVRKTLNARICELRHHMKHKA